MSEPAALLSRPSGGIYLDRFAMLDISATDVRERLSAGRSVRCLVPHTIHDLLMEADAYTHAKQASA